MFISHIVIVACQIFFLSSSYAQSLPSDSSPSSSEQQSTISQSNSTINNKPTETQNLTIGNSGNPKNNVSGTTPDPKESSDTRIVLDYGDFLGVKANLTVTWHGIPYVNFIIMFFFSFIPLVGACCSLMILKLSFF